MPSCWPRLVALRAAVAEFGAAGAEILGNDPAAMLELSPRSAVPHAERSQDTMAA
jgi:hypothetical protein